MTLILTVFRRRVIEVMRYPVELIGGVVIFYAFFLMLFAGARLFGGDEVRSGDTLSAVAVGYVVFVLAQQSYQGIGQQLLMESTEGTLEQLAMSPVGLRRVLLVDFCAQASTRAVTLGVVIVPIMLTTGRWLHLDPLSVVPLVMLTMVGVVGMGLLLAGVVVVFKRAQTAAELVGFSFLFLVAAPVFEEPILKVFPLAHGSGMLRRVMVDGDSLVSLGLSELGILVAVNLAWVTAGLLAFGALERVARDRALLGQY